MALGLRTMYQSKINVYGRREMWQNDSKVRWWEKVNSKVLCSESNDDGLLFNEYSQICVSNCLWVDSGLASSFSLSIQPSSLFLSFLTFYCTGRIEHRNLYHSEQNSQLGLWFGLVGLSPPSWHCLGICKLFSIAENFYMNNYIPVSWQLHKITLSGAPW